MGYFPRRLFFSRPVFPTTVTVMKKTLLLLLLFPLSFIFVLAQDPILTDDCEDAYELGMAPACPDSLFLTNIGATPSTGLFLPPAMESDTPSCWPEIGNDVWITFDVPADGSIVDFTVTLTGGVDSAGNDGMVQPAVAVYRGNCGLNELAELDCFIADEGESILEFDLEGLTPGLPIFLRVQEGFSAGAEAGSFTVCVDTLKPINIINEGGSTSCSGELYDTGGPDGDYSSNEQFTYTICPTNPHSCILFTLDYYNMEQGPDFLAFYDGEEVIPGNLIVQIGGPGFGDEFITGGGGVCLPIQASSGCLTVVFQSDGTNEFEGFAGSWECSSEPCADPPGFQVESTPEESTIVNSLSTAATVVTLDTIICDDEAYGTFIQGDNSDLGLDKGLVLTSGSAQNTIQPATFFSSVPHGTPGDPDLDELSVQSGNGTESNDACIVEVDVFVASDVLQFEYVFGSEEYPSFVNSSFNDIFALLISGPGIAGQPGLNGQENMAVLPDPNNTPVQINSVNYEQNWEYYRNNEIGTSVVYGGLTSDFLGEKKSLTALYEVEPCNTYHLKFAIADRGDEAYDSGVFIGEIRGGAPDIALQSFVGVEDLIEGCTGDKDSILIEVSEDIEEAITYTVNISGSALFGLDYLTTLINGQTITFSPTNLQEKFPIIPIQDGIAEGNDTIVITLTREFDCGIFPVIEYELVIRDEPEVDIKGLQDTAILCADGELQLIAAGAQDFVWSPASALSDPNIFNPLVTTDTSLWITVEGSFENTPPACKDIDSVFVNFIDPQIEIMTMDGDSICQGDTITLSAINNLNNANLIWTPEFSIVSDPTQPEIQVAPPFSITFTASVSLNSCEATASQFINVDFITPPQLITDDTLLCQGESLQLAADIPFTSSIYEWTPDDFLDDATIENPVATPQEPTLYTVITTGPSGFCRDTQSINVDVIPAIVDIPENEIFLCLGDSVTLSASSTTGSVVWTPDDGSLSSTTELTVVATPEVTTTYIASTIVGDCEPVDSIVVRVDSLPTDLDIQLFPERDFYCPGDTVSLISQNFNPDNFPDAQFVWSPDDNVLTELNNFNILISTFDTITYQRIFSNNACVDTSEILVPVFNPPPVELSLTDTIVCPGQPVPLQLLNGENPVWSGPGLSCITCPDPTATPNAAGGDVITYSVTADFMGCGSSGSLQVEISSDTFALQTNLSDTLICPEQEIQLLVLNGTNPVWTGPDLSCNECFDPIATPSVDTTYVVAGTLNNCPAFASINVEINPDTFELQVPFSDTTVCLGESIVLFVSGGDNDEYQWPPFNSLDCSDCPDPVATPIDTTDYLVSGLVDGCPAFATITVNAPDLPMLELFPDPTDSTLLAGETLQVLADTDTLDPSGLSWTLNGDPVAEGTELIELVLTFIGENTISATLIDENGCPVTASYMLEILPPQILIPDIFTPNNDGNNDVFLPVYKGSFQNYRMQIFNRWGDRVFESAEIDRGWDGTQNGKPAPMDVYVYLIEVEQPDGTVLGPFKGEISLVR